MAPTSLPFSESLVEFFIDSSALNGRKSISEISLNFLEAIGRKVYQWQKMQMQPMKRRNQV
jgi:hypothetical protein